MKRLDWVGSFFDNILNLLLIIASVALIFLLVSVNYEVVSRYFFGKPTKWVMDFAEYSVLWATFLSAAWVLKREGHVKIDLVLDRLNPRAQIVMNIITSTLCAIICFAFVWYSIQITWDHFQRNVVTSEITALPKAPIISIIPLGSIFIFLQFLRRIKGYFDSWEKLKQS